MTRYFEVKVERCGDCSFLHYSDESGNMCLHDSTPDSRDIRQTIYQQNKHQLTPTCPMWGETKESETKESETK